MAIRSIFAHHFWLKFLSLVLACLIWLTVKANIGSTSGARRVAMRRRIAGNSPRENSAGHRRCVGR